MAEQQQQQKPGFWDYATPILTGVGSAAVTGLYNNYVLNKQNSYNKAEAEAQRNYETQMSNTAYQRQAADMAAAGLNPHLAGGQGGSSTPTGVAATSGSGLPLDVTGAVNAATNAALLKSQIKNMEADTALKGAQSGKTEAETKMTEVMTDIEQAKAPLERALIEAQTNEQKSAAKKNLAEYDVRVKELARMDAEIETLKAEGKLKEAQRKQIKRLTKGIQTREWINSITGAAFRIGLIGGGI